MPVQKKNNKWYWGSQGPFATKRQAQAVGRAAYASGYKKPRKTTAKPRSR